MTETTGKISLRKGRDVIVGTPKISVVVPAYNAAEYISETLDSVFAQTFTDFEVILVNDGSPDTEKFEAAIARYMEKIVYITQPNAGAGVARNTAIDHSRGEIIAFIDGDDIWNSEFLASQHFFLTSEDLAMVYCDAELFGTGTTAGEKFMDQAPSIGDVSVDALLDLKCNVITSGTMVRKSTVAAAGMFEGARVLSEDFNLWVRIAYTGARIGYQQKALIKYRVTPDGLSGDSISRVTRAIDVFNRLENQLAGLTSEQSLIIKRRVAGFEADLALEKGKSFLINGDFRQAQRSFIEAKRKRPSLRLAIIALFSKLAPRTLLKLYRSKNAAEIPFMPDLAGTGEVKS